MGKEDKEDKGDKLAIFLPCLPHLPILPILPISPAPIAENPLSRIGKTNTGLRGLVLSIQYLQNFTPQQPVDQYK